MKILYYCTILFFGFANCNPELQTSSENAPEQYANPTVFPFEFDFSKFNPIRLLPDIKLNFRKLKNDILARGQINLNDLVLKDFSTCSGLIELFFPMNKIRVNLNVNLNDLTFAAKHQTNTHLFDLVKLKGDGDLAIAFSQLKLNMVVVLDYKNNAPSEPMRVTIEDFKIFAPNHFILTNLFGSQKDIIPKEMGETIELLLKHDSFSTIMKNILEPLLNSLFFGLNISIEKIMEIIGQLM